MSANSVDLEQAQDQVDPKAKRRHTIVVTCVALAISAVSVLAAANFTRKPPEPVPPAAGMRVGEHDVVLSPDAPQWNVLKVGKVEPAAVHWTDPVIARVRIDESRAARVGLPLNGRVTAVFVELGQSVKKGQPLLTVSSPDLATLHSDIAQARVDVEVAQAQYQRIHDMVAARLTPGKEELSAAAEKRQAELRLSTAQDKLQALKVATQHNNDFVVNAPRDGVVVEKNVLLAQEVSADQTLLQIADVSTVWVLADVFESDAVGVHAGTPVRVTLPSLPGFSVDTTVESVSAVVDPERHSVPVKVRLPNPDGKLRPNEYADVRFRVDMPTSAVEIPESSLVSDGATQYVYVEPSKGKFERRTVVAGPVRDGKVAITQGIAVGETVVIQGGILLDNQIAISH